MSESKMREEAGVDLRDCVGVAVEDHDRPGGPPHKYSSVSTMFRGWCQRVGVVGVLGFGGVEDGALREDLDDLVVLRVRPIPRRARQMGDDDEVGGVRRVDGKILVALGEHLLDGSGLVGRVHPERLTRPQSSRLVSVV